MSEVPNQTRPRTFNGLCVMAQNRNSRWRPSANFDFPKFGLFVWVIFTTVQLVTMTEVACAKNTASYWRKYTVKTMLWVSDYLLKQP